MKRQIPPRHTSNIETDALAALRRQRRQLLMWGAIALCAVVIIGAIVAPNTTLLAVVLFVVLGVLGSAISFMMRLFDRWLTGRTDD